MANPLLRREEWKRKWFLEFPNGTWPFFLEEVLGEMYFLLKLYGEDDEDDVILHIIAKKHARTHSLYAHRRTKRAFPRLLLLLAYIYIQSRLI